MEVLTHPSFAQIAGIQDRRPGAAQRPNEAVGRSIEVGCASGTQAHLEMGIELMFFGHSEDLLKNRRRFR